MKKTNPEFRKHPTEKPIRNKPEWRKAAFALFIVTALTFTATYAFNFSPRELTQKLFGASVQAASNSPTAAQPFGTPVPDGDKPDFAGAALTNGTLATARSGHTATRLDSGKVLLAGGNSAGTFEIFDPAAGASNGYGNLTTARSNHTATRLADGRVLITGGTDAGGAALSSTEIYDPSTNASTAGAAMNVARSGQTATVLGNGKILIAGGDANGSAEIYDPATGGFTSLSATMTAARRNHSAVLMNDGRVFIAGGEESASAEIFNPTASIFAPTGNSMAHHRARSVLRVLPDGKVQIIGGNDDTSMEVYDPSIDTIGAHAHLIPTNDEHDALMQIDILNAQTRAALFHHGQEDAMIDRENHSITELGNQALVAGGTNTAGQTLNTLSLVDSSGATVTTDKLDYQPGQTAVISGTGWQAGELVDIILHEDPHTHTERRMTATADASGNFTANYLVEDHDLNITFIIGAKGQTSGRTAQTTFTDASIQITSINFNLTDMASSFTAGIPNSGGMNGRLRIQSRNNSFAAETVTGSGSFITVQITTNSPTGRFDTSNGGSFTSTSLTLQILQGFQNTPDFFYKDTKAGNPAIIATVTATNGVPNLPIGYAAGLGATVNPAPAANMTFSTPPFQSVAGQCANSYGQPITVMLQDSFGNGGASPSVSKTINLTSSSGSGVFYSDPQCTVPITNVVIPTNGSSAKFYYKDTTAGTPVITASDSANIFPAVTQTETILPNFSVCSSLTFAPSSFNVGTTPFHSVTSDFNGDGKLDIAVANQSSNNISILLGNGTGGFTASTTGGIGSGPGSVAVGDFNSDGKVDLVTANVGGSFSLLFGNGTGSYPSASTFSMGSGPRSIAVGDFNGDGKDDIATANTGASSTVSVRLGNGAGNFGAVSTFTVGTFPRSIAVGDFNGDGKADLVTANDGSNNVSVLLGTGTGSFGAATNFSAGNSSTSVAIGDFNGDGKADLATANAGSNNVSVLIGTGTGSFGTPTTYSVGSAPVYVSISDFNGDGKTDIAVANQNSLNTSSVSILTGNGAGSFTTAQNFSGGNNPKSVVVGDFNSDGKPDLVATNQNSSLITVLINSCTPPPDLSITKSHVGDFAVGTNGGYTLTVSNAAGTTATSGTVTVTDTLPTGLSYVSGTGSGWSCSAVGQNVTCTTSNSIAAGASAPAINLTVGVGASTAVGLLSITNTASVAIAGETNTGNNSASDPTTVNKGDQLISFGALADKTYGDADFNVSATSDSGLTVSFAASGNCTVTGTLVHITGAGSCTITASQAGNASYNAALDVQQSFNIAKATPTITWNNPVDITYGTALGATQLNAAASTPGGFTYTPASGTVLNAGNAQNLHVDFTPTDTANYNNASKDVSINVLKATTTTVVTCPANVTYTGAALEPCSAVVTGAGGLNESPAVVYSNNTNAGTATASASYAESANYLSSTDTKNFTIDKAATTTVITCPANVTYTGSAIEPCSAVVTGAGGLNQSAAVTYSNNVNAGTATANAAYAESANHLASSASNTFTIDKAATTTVVTCPTNMTYTGAAIEPCSATVSGANLNAAVAVSYTNNVNAGMASASATYAESANHLGSTGGKTFTIDKASTVTVVTCPTNVTYTGTAQEPCTAAVTGANLNQSLTIIYANNINAGTASASASYAESANHLGSSDSKNFTIDKAATTTVVTCPANVTYTGSAQEPCTAAVTGANLNAAVAVIYSNNTNAGLASAAATYSESANHLGSSDSKTFTIDKAATTTTVTCPAAVTYTGAALEPCSAVVTGANLSQSLTVIYTNNINAGTANASAGYAESANHLASSDSESFTINKAATTTTVVCPANVTYTGAALEPCTATVTGANLNVALAVVYSNNVNAGTASASASYAESANHLGSSDTESFTIDKAATVTTVTCPANVTYSGAAIEPCSAVVTGVNGLNQSLTVSYTNNVNAGTANANAAYAESANYLGSSDSETFTIDKAATTTVVNCPSNVTYTGAALEPCTANVTGANLSSSLTVGYSNNIDAGTATASAAYAESANHLGSSDSKTFVIDKAATTTVITCPANVTYTGAAQEPCTAVVTGANLNQSVAVSYGNNVNAGTAAANASYAESANHTGSSDSKTFTIDQASSTTVVTCPASVVYNGAAQTPCTVSVTGAGDLNLTPTPSYTNNLNAGTASASYTYGGDANHTGSNDSKNFEIAKAPVTATAGGGSNVYDGATHSPSACAITGAYTGDLTCANSPATVGPNAGTTTIVPLVSGTGLSNFEVAPVNGSYTISKAPTTTTVTFEAGPYVYRGTAFTATAAVTGAVGLNSSLAPVYSGNCTNVTVANGCTATATYAESANYLGSTDSKSITVAPKPAVWTTNNNGKIFGSADPVPLTTGSGSGFLPADNVTATYSRAAGETVGTYQITATLSPSAVLVNYSITNSGATFTIGAWMLNGFHQPVGIPNTYTIPTPASFVWNTVKGGSTVPLKFNVFAGAVEQSSTGVIAFSAYEIPCSSSGTGSEDPIDFTTTGGTTLRYSGTPGVDGQYIQNWQTPSAPNKCYRVQMRTADNSSLFAFFKTKK